MILALLSILGVAILCALLFSLISPEERWTERKRRNR